MAVCSRIARRVSRRRSLGRIRIASSVAESYLTPRAQEGHGLFVTPTAIEAEVKRQYSVRVIGRIPEIKERYYAISIERRIKHPAVLAISNAARNKLFGVE